MTRLIDNLLNVARITQGKIDLRLAPLDLISLLRRAMESVQGQVDERAQELIASLPTEPLYVLGDATRLEQAFGNLLGNASKFTNRSGRIWFNAEFARRRATTSSCTFVTKGSAFSPTRCRTSSSSSSKGACLRTARRA